MHALHQPLTALAASRKKKHCVNFATQQDKRKMKNNKLQHKL